MKDLQDFADLSKAWRPAFIFPDCAFLQKGVVNCGYRIWMVSRDRCISVSQHTLHVIILLTITLCGRVNASGNGPSPEIDALIEVIAASESLFQDLDITWTLSGVAPKDDASKPAGPTLPEGFSKFIDEQYTVHTVFQSGLYYAERKGSMLLENGNRQSLNRLTAFNGVETKCLDQDVLGNISPRERQDDFILLPHMALLHGMYIRAPLSVFLSGTEAMVSKQDTKWDANHKIQVTLGEEDATVADMRCKIVYVQQYAGDVRHSGWKLWLASERNLIPVRVEGFTYKHSERIPKYIATVGTMKEIEPAVWFPMSMKAELYRFPKSNENPVKWRTNHISVDTISLSPAYPPAFFSKLDFPNGVAVYVLDENNNIQRNYVVGAPPQ